MASSNGRVTGNSAITESNHRLHSRIGQCASCSTLERLGHFHEGNGTETPLTCASDRLSETDANIASHFTLPEVQYVGSTSECGCDFPHTTVYSDVAETDPELEASERFNREGLVRLLRESGEEMVELYGIWLSDWKKDPLRPEVFREDISLAKILEPTFRFKE